jgi:glycosyltransferase involved in cell wall biosynthesis
MRILICHNAYQQRGGEDMVVQAEQDLLVSRGHEVRLFSRHNDEVKDIGPASLALQTLWSRNSHDAIAADLARWRPDIVHVHNTFPLISPSVYWASAHAGIPVVQTLHNFRLLCPQAMFLRDGKVCEDCLGRLPWRGAARGCYRGSSAQSSVLAGMLMLHRALGTWQHKVSRYIALNRFCRDKFIAGGLPAERIAVKPNFVDCDAPEPLPREGFLFVGRLSAEKGLAVLASAVVETGLCVQVAGVGPEAHAVEGLAKVKMLGALTAREVFWRMARARALVLPSIWYENFPRTVVEAYANGLPVIASRLGSLAELVVDGETGLLFEPGDSRDLAQRLCWAQAHPIEMAAMGRNARAHYEAEFTADRNYDQLMAIYREAIDEPLESRPPP